MIKVKIKTITCHDVYNVGASLQAYALSQYLTLLGHDVEIIDYKPDYLSGHYKLNGISNPRYDKPILRQLYLVAKFPGRLKARLGKRKKEYDTFTRTYLPLTRIRYASNEMLKKSPPIADVYFAGSDQIWNTVFKNGRDPAFYLDFAPEDSIKASYAASFATEDIIEEYKPQVQKWLSSMDYISVRERSGVDIINDLGINGAVQVQDPVFLLKKEQWKKVEKRINIETTYILVYDFDKNELVRDFVQNMAKKNDWKIYSILPCDYADKCFDQEGPLTFLTLIHNATLVVSNSFHATAFSLIYEKQFVVFNRKEKINTRMRDMLISMDLSERLITNIGQSIKIIDYKDVNEKLEPLISDSKQYIENVLSGGRNDR